MSIEVSIEIENGTRLNFTGDAVYFHTVSADPKAAIRDMEKELAKRPPENPVEYILIIRK